MLSEQAIIEYQEIYKKMYGVKITLKEARLQGENFINSFKLVFKPTKQYETHRQSKDQISV